MSMSRRGSNYNWRNLANEVVGGVRAARNVYNQAQRVGNQVNTYLRRRRQSTQLASRQVQSRNTRRTARNSVSTGVSTRRATIKQIGQKKTAFKLAKRVKVSSSFRKKVDKVLENKKYYGTNMDVFYMRTRQESDNLQTIFQFSANPTVAATNSDGRFFSPLYFANMASQLWREFTPTYQVTAGNTGLIDLQTSKLTVVDSHVTIIIRNNQQLATEVIMYECAPKNVLADDDPYDTWEQGFFLDRPGSTQQTLGNGPNPQLINPLTMFATPEQTRTFNKYWKVSKTYFKLEAGQTATMVIQGPKMLDLDYNKFWKENVFQNVQKFTRGCFAIVRNEVNGSGAIPAPGVATVGRYGLPYGTVAPAVESVLFEQRRYCKLCMPDMTGFKLTIPTVGSTVNVPLNQRTQSYIITSYAAAQDGSITRVDPLNPADPEVLE